MRPLVVLLMAVAVGAAPFARGDTLDVADIPVVVKFAATLSGEEAVPGPGDPNGSGTVNLRVNMRKQKVCQVMRLSGVPDADIANVRRGRRGDTGPIVVDLDVLGRVTRSCTTSVPSDTLRAVRRHPRRFYVNVTSDSHPRSAVRGQLKRVKDGGRHGPGTTTSTGTTGPSTGTTGPSTGTTGSTTSTSTSTDTTGNIAGP
jgi:hypothetical protein